jgi:hypothetical protein
MFMVSAGGDTGSFPQAGPCSFYATWDQVLGCCNNLQPVEDAMRDVFLDAATMVVYGLTKQKYIGQCSRTMFPCQPGCIADNCCTCSQRVRFDLGTTPVWWAQVIADGVEIPIHIEDFRYLVRDDEHLWWPTCQVAWSIQYTFGWPVPMDIQLATARLACEMAKQCAGQDCALDPRTTSYSREGVSVTIADPASMISSGKTGIPFVDMIIGNPLHQRSGGIVDLAADVGYSTTWSPPVVPT